MVGRGESGAQLTLIKGELSMLVKGDFLGFSGWAFGCFVLIGGLGLEE